MSTPLSPTPRLEGTGRPPRRPRRRGGLPPIDAKRLLVVAAGFLAGLLNYLLIVAGDGDVLVGVARVAIDPGTVISPEQHLDFLPISADDDLLARMTTAPDQVRGAVAVGPIEAGAPILPEMLLAAGHDPDLRVLSIPVDRYLAAGGDLERGDLVDVVAVDQDDPALLATEVTVLATAAESSGFGQYHVVVVVPRGDVGSLAAAIERSTVMLVRAGRGL